MKIYNAKAATVQLPLGIRRLVISGKSLSQDFMPTSQFLQMIARTFTPNDMALIVSGAWEGNMCAETPTLSEYCVSSVEEALARFNPPKAEESKKEDPEPEVAPEIKEEPKTEEPKPEVESNEDKKNEEPEKEPKKAKRVRTARKVTRKKKTDEEKSTEE